MAEANRLMRNLRTPKKPDRNMPEGGQLLRRIDRPSSTTWGRVNHLRYRPGNRARHRWHWVRYWPGTGLRSVRARLLVPSDRPLFRRSVSATRRRCGAPLRRHRELSLPIPKCECRWPAPWLASASASPGAAPSRLVQHHRVHLSRARAAAGASMSRARLLLRCFVVADACLHQRFQEFGRQRLCVGELDEAGAGFEAGGLDCALVVGEEFRSESK
jgi:hypothetical protein